MKLTVKLDYALRALTRLAKRYESGQVTRIEELADIEEIPANYLAQILSELRNGGLVASKRGKQGGYLLARSPEEITLHDVIGLIQGDLFQAMTQAGGASGPSVGTAWGRLQKSFETSARSIALSDLAASVGQDMYYI